jgi:hypothetical protein
MGAGLNGLPGDRNGDQPVRFARPGPRQPTARRGRHRTKAERANRQRRESRGRIAPACPRPPFHARFRSTGHGQDRCVVRRTARSARP